MYSDLVEMINQGKYDDVIMELEKYNVDEYTEELMIIAASAFLAVGNDEKACKYLQLGLQINAQCDELYLLLGNYYEKYNFVQAYLCYENAELYCRNKQDKDLIRSFKRRLEQEMGVVSKKTSIILFCYDSLDQVKRCIESIQNNRKNLYEIIAICCATTEESVEWLKQREDVVLVKNAENVERKSAYKQGIEAANPSADIMLMDSGMELFSNSLFWLKMALYENEKTGAVGSQIYRQSTQEKHIFIKKFSELRFYLDKLPILIRREAIDEVGLPNVQFAQCTSWEKDFGLRLYLAGWENILCYNSYFRHSKNEKSQDTSLKERFSEKYFFNMVYDANSFNELIEFINADKQSMIRILLVGYELDEKLRELQSKYPNGQVYGIDFSLEKTETENRYLNVVRGDSGEFIIPFGNKRFDYIILSDVLEYVQNPEKIMQKLLMRLKSNGAFLCNIPNFMNLPVLYFMMKCDIEYENIDILNMAYLSFFNLNNIRRLFDKCGVYIDKLKYKNIDIKEMDQQFLEYIKEILEHKEQKSFLVQQYMVRAQVSAKEFKITAVGLIKNAADVIETYIRANGLLVDNFVLLDNMCSDRTILILEQLKQEGFEIEIIEDKIIEHDQREKMNRLIYYVNEKYHPDYIVPIDDDECIAPSSERDTVEDIRQKIRKLSPNNLYYLKWKIYVPTEEDDESEICAAKRQTYCCEDTEEALNKVIIPGKVLQDGTFSILSGNHGGSGNLVEDHILLPFARMAHFPCRSEAQLRSKVLTGWTNCLAFPGRMPDDAAQWRYMYAVAKKGEKLSLEDLQMMALIYTSSPELNSVCIKKDPIHLPGEAMIMKYTKLDEVNPWENYCTNVEMLAQKYAELKGRKSD